MNDLEKKLITLFLSIEEDEFYLLADFFEAHRKDIQEDPDRYRPYALKDPWCSLFFALDIDMKARDDTRNAACKDAFNAFEYAICVDGCATLATYKACLGSDYEDKYVEELGKYNGF